MNKEQKRLQEDKEHIKYWKRWGPYLSERAWGTVREDYSEFGNAWDYFPHDHARSRVYRWNEDGLAGICDRHQLICFSLAFWNGQDPILKERLFGLSGNEGNHGEDVKEYYFYLDNTPTHSYMKYLYKYPHQAFPYDALVRENRNRDKHSPEFELIDTGVFDENRYFDVEVEYAKADVEDILVRINVTNHGPETADLTVLPTVWFRNTWSWADGRHRPELKLIELAARDFKTIALNTEKYGTQYLYCENTPQVVFTENETNFKRLFNLENPTPHVKDGINDYIVHGLHEAVNPDQIGTKAAAHYQISVTAGNTITLQLRLTREALHQGSDDPFGKNFDVIFDKRKDEANDFYQDVIPEGLPDEEKNVMRQSFSGLLWSKQFYHYIVQDWLAGDPKCPPPPSSRIKGRNSTWGHLYNADIISMPDKWEYPWYAAWDLAFHCVPFAKIDPDFAKEQLILMLREWYMHPSGQLPAYEWALNDVNPPVHAWAALKVYQIDKEATGQGDTDFLERVFHKLMLNFTWWVNRKDKDFNNVFEGGFLGLDNISVFDRSAGLPLGGYIEQSDGTSWMAMYTLNLMAIALELAKHDKTYEDVASKFWEHFIYISHALNHIGKDNVSLWNEEDSFYYDMLHFPDGTGIPLKVRSLVGLIPLFAVTSIDADHLESLPNFRRRLEWFIENRPELVRFCACMRTPGNEKRRLFSLVDALRLTKILGVMLSETEFLSPYGIRSISKIHETKPYELTIAGNTSRVDYEPGESTSGLFGGNSNWRGPIWFPINFLLVEALERFHVYIGDDFQIECPTGSGNMMNLHEVANELSSRLTRIFLPDSSGRRPVFGQYETFQTQPDWFNHIPFHEYFHGDTGAGIGASHQTGWTALVANLFQTPSHEDPVGLDDQLMSLIGLGQ